jgi:tetratricopeptide (TPR) repeat protein
LQSLFSDIDRARSLLNMSLVYSEQNDLNGKLYAEQAYTMFKENIENDQANQIHRDISQSLIILGGYANRDGQYCKANKYFFKACQYANKNLQKRYRDNDFRELPALEQEEHIYEMQKELFIDDDHPFLIETLLNLASFYSCRNLKEKSIGNSKMAIDMHMRLNNDEVDQPGLVRVLLRVAQCYSNINMEQDSIELKRRALNIQRVVFNGRAHPEISATLRSLSSSYSKLNETNSIEMRSFTRTVYADYFTRMALLAFRNKKDEDKFLPSLTDMNSGINKLRHNVREYELSQLSKEQKKKGREPLKK